MVKIWPIDLGAALGAATVTRLGVGALGAGFDEFVARCVSDSGVWGEGAMVFGCFVQCECEGAWLGCLIWNR